MLQIQYDLFEECEETRLHEMEKKIDEIKTSCDKVRKGMFARHGELFKLMKDIDNRLKMIESYICKS